MIRSFIQMTALILTLGASIFLLKSNIGLTPETISKLSSTYWGYNTPIAKEFAGQAANTRVGVILLLVAFILQIINALWPMRWKDFGINWHGILIALGCSIILLIFAHLYSKKISEKMHKETIKIFQEQEKAEEKADS